jgi:hypothetical protein
MKKLVFLTCLVLLSACSKDDDEMISQTRTVLIYMSAENSLSHDSENDLLEIFKGSQGLNDNDNLLVYYDRASSDELPWLARIVKGHLRDSVSIADLQISDKDEHASNPKVFEKVLSYAFSHYPATTGYGLTFWGHATGWLREDSLAYTRGYGVDNNTNSMYNDIGPWLNIPTLRMILEKQPHLEFIFADCCNFMCLESIYELREVTDYIIGSPAEIPDFGAPYDKVVPEMFKRQNAARGIMEKYAEDNEGTLPLAVVKTSEVDALAEATRNVLSAIYGRLQEQGTEYPDMKGLIHYYNEYRWGFYQHYNIYYDAGDFVKKHATDAEYRQWKEVFDRTVTDKAFAERWLVNKSWNTYYTDFEMTEEKYHGVSMFVPQNPEEGNYGSYNEDIKKFGWWWKTWNAIN